jgi:hypothetical protein
MRYIDNITAETVRKLLDYDPETGLFTWKPRTPDMFDSEVPELNCKLWNGKFAGKQAGSIGRLGYIVIMLKPTLWRAHRLAWLHYYGDIPKDDIDHINMVTSDNRIENLRLLRGMNLCNRPKQRNNTSGYKGVSWDKRDKRYSTTVYANGKQAYRAYHLTAEEAYADYCRVAKELHGEFFRP